MKENRTLRNIFIEKWKFSYMLKCIFKTGRISLVNIGSNAQAFEQDTIFAPYFTTNSIHIKNLNIF